ncbi:hypothetical protein P5673_001572 [Acropora cervicornis]|uniref:Uncharacterized protein n=1 Tax=Acropora cervicornis TaxID=6130 RepID=A0AAD9R6M6_ACRCE|nr:hypothetical protein P5673_001572 [Acropora cervicornis]
MRIFFKSLEPLVYLKDLIDEVKSETTEVTTSDKNDSVTANMSVASELMRQEDMIKSAEEEDKAQGKLQNQDKEQEKEIIIQEVKWDAAEVVEDMIIVPDVVVEEIADSPVTGEVAQDEHAEREAAFVDSGTCKESAEMDIDAKDVVS